MTRKAENRTSVTYEQWSLITTSRPDYWYRLFVEQGSMGAVQRCIQQAVDKLQVEVLLASLGAERGSVPL